MVKQGAMGPLLSRISTYKFNGQHPSVLSPAAVLWAASICAVALSARSRPAHLPLPPSSMTASSTTAARMLTLFSTASPSQCLHQLLFQPPRNLQRLVRAPGSNLTTRRLYTTRKQEASIYFLYIFLVQNQTFLLILNIKLVIKLIDFFLLIWSILHINGI